MKFDNSTFCKKFKLFKGRKSIEKMIYIRRKIGVNKGPRSSNPGKATAMAMCPIIYLVHASEHDMACEFVCPVRIHRHIITDSTNVLKA